MGTFIGVGRIRLTLQGCLPISEIGWSFSSVCHSRPSCSNISFSLFLGDQLGAFELVKKLLPDKNVDYIGFL